MKKEPDVITGYWYGIGAHLCLCHGPVDAFTKIRVGEKTIWSGNVATTSEITINQPNAFGGEDREGGFIGKLDLVKGSATESVNAYLQAVLPDAEPMPAFRNRACVVLKDPWVAANNPNIRPIAVEVERIPSPGWYDEKSKPGTAGGVNPAHIIRECLINPVWGLGYSSLEVNDTKFRAAADKLYDEGFGLSLVWQSSGSIYDFLSGIIQHIQGVLYVDPRTGLFVLDLVRDDYSLNSLSTFGEDEILSVDDYGRTGVSELINQVTVIWYEAATDKQKSVTVHNPATRQLQGGTVATTLEFPGIPDAALAMKVAARELKKLSTSVSRAVVTTDRSGANLQIGSVFKMSWPDLKIVNAIMRVGKIEYGGPGDNRVRLHCVEDIFGSGYALYDNSLGTLWQDPISAAQPCPHRRLFEVTYLDVASYLGESDTAMSEVDTGAGMVAMVALPATDDTFSYRLMTRVGSAAFARRDIADFCPSAIITGALQPQITSSFQVSTPYRLEDVQIHTYAFINDEIVSVTGISDTSITVTRGVLDTIPVAHSAGSRIWFAQDNMAIDTTQWANNGVVGAKALTLTGKGLLAEANAPEDTVTITRRWHRPYPPADLRLNGDRWPFAVIGDIVLDWRHRDRTLQLSGFLSQSDASIGPEAGTTYTVAVRNEFNTVVRTITGLTTTTWTYTAAMIQADNPGGTVTFELWSERGGLASRQKWSLTVNRS